MRAVRAAMRKSHDSASENPVWIATPLIAAMRQFVEPANGRVEALRNRPQAVVGADRVVVSGWNARHQRFAAEFGIAIGLQIVAGAERAAGAGEDDDAHPVVHLRLRDRLDQIAFDRGRHAVQAFRRIELNPRDAGIAHRDFEAGKFAGVHLLCPLQSMAASILSQSRDEAHR